MEEYKLSVWCRNTLFLQTLGIGHPVALAGHGYESNPKRILVWSESSMLPDNLG